MTDLIAQAWAKARNAWMTQTRHGTQEQADAAAIEVLTAELRAQAAEQPAEAMARYKLTRSIIHKCPALVLPQDWAQKLGMMAQIIPLHGLDQTQAEALLADLNPAPRIAQLEGLLGEVIASWHNVEENRTTYQALIERIEAALGGK